MCEEGKDEVVLAEGRHRLKWTSDPRNTFWSKDKGRYGYRLLEQMGWQEGKGLGVCEDGQKEHIRVSKKTDRSGVGTVRDRDSDWIAGQDSFNDILSELNSLQKTTSESNSKGGSEGGVNSLVSTAERSQKIKYHKFLKSKDLSMKSDTDLDCVLGKKKKKLKNGKKHKSIESSSDEPHIISGTDNSSTSKTDLVNSPSCWGLRTVKSELSVQDYFNQKMKKITAKR